MLLRSKGCGKRDDLLLFLLQGPLQQRMSCLPEVHLPVVGNNRHARDEVEGDLCLCHEEVNLSEISGSIEKIRDVRPEEISEFQQDTEDLALLGEFKFLDLIVEFDHFRRLDERCLTCGRLIIYESGNALLVCRTYRNEHLAVTYGYACIAVYDSFLLSLLEDCAHSAGNGSLLVSK